MNEKVATPPGTGRRLTIGAVCAALRIDHPDISISKIRYLEEQGLLHPQRTRGGYRLFAQEDVERLRTILRLQRDEFLPLRVIREELEKATEGARQRPRRRPVSTGAARGPRFGELLSAANVNEEFVRSLEEFGLIEAEAGRFRPEDVQIVAAAARLQRYGFDARHLRAVHSAIQREAGLVEQVLAPQLRSANPDRVGAGLEQLDELAGLCAELTESLLVRDLRRLAVAGDAPEARGGQDVIDLLTARIRDVPDFPKPGIVFKDITPLLADPQALAGAVDTLAERVAPLRPEIVLGAESRGFILGPALAIRLGVGFAIARKPGKLPWKTVTASYALEYGEDSLELHEDAIAPGMRVLVHDDLLATGGTARATCDLAEAIGGTVVGCAFLIELAFLGGRGRLAPFPVEALISYSSED